LGVKGHEEELRSASNEFSGHCLALTLLGSYLSDAYKGDIRCRTEVSKRFADDVRQGAHARKVMESYQAWVGEGPELSVLRLLGLFDRPADEKAIRTLLEQPAISGLTEALIGLSSPKWRTILARLRRARLLTEEDPHNPDCLDTHPLVREYFGEQLQSRPAAWQEGNRRLYNYYRNLALPLPDSFRDMEPLFLAVVCGCKAGLFRDALHEIYIPRIQRGNASFAAKTLGVRGALLSILVRFFSRGRWGFFDQTMFQDQSLTDEDQLFILMQAGMYLAATRGHSAPEARICYERAGCLCSLLGRPLPLYAALMGQWRYSFLTDKLTATMQIAKQIYSLAQEQKNLALMIGAHQALGTTHYFIGNFEAARQHSACGVQIWRSGDIPTLIEEVSTPAVICLCYQALCEWHFEEIALCQLTIAEAISLAKELNDMHALAVALYIAGFLRTFERNTAEVERVTSDLIELSMLQNFPLWLAGGEVLRGWARSASGRPTEGISLIDAGIQNHRATGSIRAVPFFLALKAEALHLADRTPEALETIKEAEALVEKSEGRWWCAELHRLRGVFLAAIGGAQIQIEASFRAAIRTAKHQKSVSLATRAESSYAEYRRRSGKL